MTSTSREWDSSAYHRLSGPQLSWGRKVLARVQLRGDETLLDAGCGSGRLPFKGAFDGIFSTATFHWVLDHDRLFRSLHGALRSGGWLRAQCGGGPNLERLRKRMAGLAASPKYARFLGGFAEPWTYSDAETAAERLRRAGFQHVETSLEPALTLLDNAERYCEFIRAAIVHRHLQRIPEAGLRDEFVQELTRQAAEDDPLYSLDYWRLNLSGDVA